MTGFLMLPPWLDRTDVRIVLFVGFVVALLMLSRWASKYSDVRTQESGFVPAEPAAIRVTQKPGQPSPDAPLEPPAAYGQVVVKSMWFKTFDTPAGPPDPKVFCDELTVEIYHRDTGETSEWSYTVGTPEGFARLLNDKNWAVFFAPEVIVVRSYDKEIIRQTVVDRYISDIEGDEALRKTGREEL